MNRYAIDLPKIGIRPCIDGRRNGVREGLEVQTMNMAKAAAKLIADNIRYPNGDAVEIVLADTTIGGVKEAAACQAKFEKAGVTITLSVSPCWCYSTEVMDFDPQTVKAVWGFNGTERPGAVFLAAVLSAHAQKGLPAFGIYGHDVKDATDTEIPEDVARKILLFAQAALAAKGMRQNSYLQVGSMCMGIAGSILDQETLYEYFGLRSESVDETEILRRIDNGIYDKEEFERALKWTKEYCHEGIDKNPADIQYSRAEKDAQWEFVVKSMLIVRDLMVGNPRLAEMGFVEEADGHNAIVAGIQGQRQWTDYKPNFDFLEAMLNSQFDWYGLREAFVVGTENDTLNAMTMLFEHLLTNRPGIFADVRTYWSPEAVKRVTGKELKGHAKDGIIHLINSGAASLDGTGAVSDKDGNPVIKPFYEMTDADAKACLSETDWCAADQFYFRGGGYSSHFIHGTRGGMPVTMARLNIVKGLGPVLQLAEGYTCELEPDVHKTLDERTDKTWPTTWFAPTLTGRGAFTDVYSVMANWGANHGAFCYGHIGDLLITMASMLRIPVSMHNVDSSRVFRPAAWSAFGTDDLESADYRACAVYGPMYK
ncbi:MAG: L-fucose isomerase [Firmicutes bacterium HGW-Firmicutes-9]|jgi:L-fucose isomerase|nr:MAG: L-fucose isomerase [Firmicutes bacterium HGW-Firmicutes-9]